MSSKEGVTVGVLCYNHEPYVAQCLDSILAQKCDFPFTVYVYDDVSTDDSWEIIKTYKERYGEQIIIEQPKKNSFQAGVVNAFMRSVQRVNHNKYLAICEADDYWTDEYKLQKQYEALEQHPDAVMCVCNVGLEDVMNHDANMGIVPGDVDAGWTQEELVTRLLTSRLGLRINGCFFASTVLQSLDLSSQYWDYWATDQALFALYLIKGDCVFLPDKMANKRVNNAGSYSYQTNIEKDICDQKIRQYEADLRWIKEFDKLSQGKYANLMQYYNAYRNVKMYYLRKGNSQYCKWVSDANGKMYRREICRKINRAYAKLIKAVYGNEECRFIPVAGKWMEKEWQRIQKQKA